MRFFLLIWTLLLPVLPAAAQSSPDSFSFIALGDMPYRVPKDVPRYEKLISRINGLKPAFSIHVGDFKSGSRICSNEVFNEAKAQFDLFEQPLVYSIGDNEWTDCHRDRAGRFDPVERLGTLRQMFFAEARSLGKQAMSLERQADLMPAYATYVENTRFTFNKVMFVQPHIVGSNNGFEPRNLAAVTEFFGRNAANIAWLNEAFTKAKADNLAAVVISFQANIWANTQHDSSSTIASGFLDMLRTIERGAKDFGKPVLLIQGDYHTLLIEEARGLDRKPMQRVTRLQVMGEDDMGAVRVTVNPSDPIMPFSFQPFYEPE